MSYTISEHHPERRRIERWRSGLLALIAVFAVLAACSEPASSEPEAPARLLETPAAVAAASAGGGQSLVDSDELIGLGELGLLPSLLQTFGTGIECDFDDAFSTCQ